MSKREYSGQSPRDFGYSNIMAKPTYMGPPDTERTLKCIDCPTMFTTRARTRKRCIPCQVEADKRAQKRANEKKRRQVLRGGTE